MHTTHPTPSKEAIALLDPFERLGLDRIELVQTLSQAERALDELARRNGLGLRHRVQAHLPEDTRSRTGRTWCNWPRWSGPGCSSCTTRDCRAVTADALARPGVVKAGFGLGDDRKRITEKLGVEPPDVLDLNHVFRQRGYRKDMGVKGAVAVLFNRRFIKSGKASTSNWANAAPDRSPADLRRQRRLGRAARVPRAGAGRRICPRPDARGSGLAGHLHARAQVQARVQQQQLAGHGARAVDQPDDGLGHVLGRAGAAQRPCSARSAALTFSKPSWPSPSTNQREVIRPGQTALTRISGASARARYSVIALTAPLEAM